MVKTSRAFGAVYSDFLLTDESIRFIGGQIDILCSEFDKLIEGPRNERLDQVCDQISSLYGKSKLEERKLQEIREEFRGFGVPKRFLD